MTFLVKNLIIEFIRKNQREGERLVKELSKEEEIVRLKFKVNKLLDKIDEQAQEKTMLENQLKVLKIGNKLKFAK